MSTRDTAVTFMKLTMTRRLEIARLLGVDEGLGEFHPRAVSIEICRRVREHGLIHEFGALVWNLDSAVPPPEVEKGTT